MKDEGDDRTLDLFKNADNSNDVILTDNTTGSVFTYHYPGGYQYTVNSTGTTGTSPGTITLGGTGAITTPNYAFGLTGTSVYNTDWNFAPAPLHVQGDAVFEGEVKIHGVNLGDRLNQIEERLNILHPNPQLEDRWAELKALGERYRQLEQEIIEKEKIWATLKK